MRGCGCKKTSSELRSGEPVLSTKTSSSHNKAMAQGTVKQKVKTEPKKCVSAKQPVATQDLATDSFTQGRKADWSSDRQQSHQAQEGRHAEAGTAEEGARNIGDNAQIEHRLIPTQKHTAGLITLTERSLAEKAGHLEMLKGGKKDRLEKAKNKAFSKKK